MRLFLAIFPPNNYISYFRDVLQTYDKQKRNIKPLPVDQIHVTLKFFGSDVSQESLELITTELERYTGRYPKPVIQINRIQFGFSYQNDPRVIMADVEENEDLTDLSEFVYLKVRDLGLRDTIRWRNKFSDSFHITIARTKDTATRSTGKIIGKITKSINLDPPAPFTPEYIDLVESKMTPKGPVYRRIGRIRL